MTLQELDRLRNLVIRSEIKPTDSIEEMVFKAYLKHENLKDTADEINNLQIKKDNNDFIKISKETVSEIIKDKNAPIRAIHKKYVNTKTKRYVYEKIDI